LAFKTQGQLFKPKINAGVANTGIIYHFNRYIEVTNSFNGIAPIILEATNLQNECKQTYQVLKTNYMVWYDYAVTRLCSF
jgi:hypothetical protein